MDSNYQRAYTEVNEVLSNMEKEDLFEIPNEVILAIRNNMDKSYSFKIDASKSLREQNLSMEARAILANLYRDYWADEEEKAKIIEFENFQKEKHEELKRRKQEIIKERNRREQERILKEEEEQRQQEAKTKENNKMIKMENNIIAKFSNYIKTRMENFMKRLKSKNGITFLSLCIIILLMTLLAVTLTRLDLTKKEKQLIDWSKESAEGHDQAIVGIQGTTNDIMEEAYHAIGADKAEK